MYWQSTVDFGNLFVKKKKFSNSNMSISLSRLPTAVRNCQVQKVAPIE